MLFILGKSKFVLAIASPLQPVSLHRKPKENWNSLKRSSKRRKLSPVELVSLTQDAAERNGRQEQWTPLHTEFLKPQYLRRYLWWKSKRKPEEGYENGCRHGAVPFVCQQSVRQAECFLWKLTLHIPLGGLVVIKLAKTLQPHVRICSCALESRVSDRW